MKRRVMISLAAAILLCTASFAYAHHSHPLFYDQCRKVTIDGRVESVQWKNPHVLIVIRMDDGKTYTGEWDSLQGLTNHGDTGPAQAALMVGARVVVVGNPMRDQNQIRASFPDLPAISNTNVVDALEIRRSDNSWKWARAQAQTPPECK
jgi:hypothetical protein